MKKNGFSEKNLFFMKNVFFCFFLKNKNGFREKEDLMGKKNGFREKEDRWVASP